VREPRESRDRSAQEFEPLPSRGAPARSGALWLYGLHAVAAALANRKRSVRRLLASEEGEVALTEVLPPPWRVHAERSERGRFATFLPEGAVHQGLALQVEPLEPPDLETLLETRKGPVLVLDQVTDPRNVGACLRAAAAFGAAGIIVQDRHAPEETGSLARAASGALELVPMVRETNIARAIEKLKELGAWVIGLDGGATDTLREARTTPRRLVLVLGSEDAGLRRNTAAHCDQLARIPIERGVESLNVATAAAVALYECTVDAREQAEDEGEDGDLVGDDTEDALEEWGALGSIDDQDPEDEAGLDDGGAGNDNTPGRKG